MLSPALVPAALLVVQRKVRLTQSPELAQAALVALHLARLVCSSEEYWGLTASVALAQAALLVVHHVTRLVCQSGEECWRLVCSSEAECWGLTHSLAPVQAVLKARLVCQSVEECWSLTASLAQAARKVGRLIHSPRSAQAALVAHAGCLVCSSGEECWGLSNAPS